MAFEIKKEERMAPTQLSPGFWFVDLARFPAQQVTDWLIPGTKYYEHPEEADTLPQIAQDGIELWHEAQIVRNSGQKYVLFVSCIPNSLVSRLRGHNTNAVKYLGTTWSAARTALNSSTVWNACWPLGYMDTVIFGWENAGT